MHESNVESMGWNWDNSYSRLSASLYTLQQPVPVAHPQIVVLNDKLAEQLHLNLDILNREYGQRLFSGNELPDQLTPLAQAYAGHQFGQFTMLGDGRAILLGEHLYDGKRVDIQLKGSGKTVYSRGGDGRAALGPMIREYIISEALHYLHVPTTRSLAIVETGEEVQRERRLPGAILTRVAASHLRVGTFQYVANWCGIDELNELVDYAMQRHYAEYIGREQSKALDLLTCVIRQQAKLIAQWQSIGFIHGVMNTDNMTISGESIDFGPCAFMNRYHDETVFSSIDQMGRYAYRNQPYIGGWNLARLAEALLPLIDNDSAKALDLAQHAIQQYGTQYEANWLQFMKSKLGLTGEMEDDVQLVNELLSMMKQTEADFTNTFRDLTKGLTHHMTVDSHPDWQAWLTRWMTRRQQFAQSLEASTELMQRSNPVVIARNHIVEAVIHEAVVAGDYEPLEQLIGRLRNPYRYHQEVTDKYCEPPTSAEDEQYVTYCGT